MKKFRAFGILPIILIILGVLLILGTGGWIVYNEFFKKESKEKPKEEAQPRDETSDWLTYNQPEECSFSIKYPPTWTYEENYTAGFPDTEWLVVFTPPDAGSPFVLIDAEARDLETYKTYLTEELPVGFDIEGEAETTIDEQEGTKLSVHGKACDYPEYIYYIPYFNLSYTLQGPANDRRTEVENEDTIFQLMLDSFKFSCSEN